MDLKINDPLKAKQTETTQRVRLRLVTRSGEEFPTKVEFSRRASQDDFVEDNVDTEISGRYKRLSFRCQHFSGRVAASQKIRALAHRPVTQARDVFDLYILYLGNHLQEKQKGLDSEIIESARENALSISYDQYRGQVEEYLTQNGLAEFGGLARWNKIQTCIVDLI